MGRPRLQCPDESSDVLMSLQTYRITSDMLDILWIQIREPAELRLIQIHHKQLIGRREVRLLRGELLVEIVDVLPVLLWT